jgi:hypothetical protein
MERASQALVAREYLECERLCTEALQLAREAKQFERLGRIMLPLQECRRQRRQIAADHGVVALTGDRKEPAAVLDAHPQGCLLLTSPPYSQADAKMLRDMARQREAMVEVLLLDQPGLVAAFEKAAEDQGDAAIARYARCDDPLQVIDGLLGDLETIGDHEKAHQRVTDAANRASRK